MLTLFEECYLLSIHEGKGTIMASKEDDLRFVLGGALLAELALMRKIGLKDNQRLEVLDSTPPEDDILIEALETIKSAEKERKISYWINVFIQKPDKFRKRLAKRLVQAGVVSQEDDRFQWVIPAPNSSDQNASAKYLMKNRIRDLVLASAQAESREIALLSLVKASNLLDLIFVKDERKLADRRIHELVVAEALKNPALQTIEAIAVVVESEVEED
jgi:hypothetical protein